MNMLSWKNFSAHPLTTLGGALLGVLQAAAVAAAAVFTSSGNVTDPKPYIAAAGVGAATFLIGGLLPSGVPAPADPPIILPAPATTSEAPPPEPVAAAPVIPPEVAAAAQQLM